MASTECRYIEASYFCDIFLEEIDEVGVLPRVRKFVEEYGEVPATYKILLAQKFDNAIPESVADILAELQERIDNMKRSIDTGGLTLSPKGPVVTSAMVMAYALSEVRALNHIMGE